jgi:branched-chain amino acid transport system ATP-binding protein
LDRRSEGALVTNPRVLILDDAAGGLAPLIRDEIWTTIRLVRDAGIATLLVDKNAAEVTAAADRTMVLVKGETVFGGQPPALLADAEKMHGWLGV